MLFFVWPRSALVCVNASMRETDNMKCVKLRWVERVEDYVEPWLGLDGADCERYALVRKKLRFDLRFSVLRAICAREAQFKLQFFSVLFMWGWSGRGGHEGRGGSCPVFLGPPAFCHPTRIRLQLIAPKP